MINNKQKIGIALEGGGAKGAYQIGVLKAIMESGIQYDCVTGTSIGALNAPAYVLGDFENFFSKWKSMKFSFNLKSDKNQSIKLVKLTDIINNVEEFEKAYLNSEGLSPDEIINLLKESIDEYSIRKSKIKLGISTYCLTDRKPLNIFIEDIPNGMLHEYIFASCNLPVFTPRPINGKYYLDGGVFNQLPIDMIAELGYKTIITVRLRKDKYDFSKFPDVNFIDIAPDEYLSNTLEASSERIEWMIDKGYKDATQKIKISDAFLK